MEQLIILQGVTLSQLLTQIEALIGNQIKQIAPSLKEEEPNKLMSRKDVADYLQISLPTLSEWTKMGWLRSYKIGNRVLYKSKEVDNSLRERKYGRQ